MCCRIFKSQLRIGGFTDRSWSCGFDILLIRTHTSCTKCSTIYSVSQSSFVTHLLERPWLQYIWRTENFSATTTKYFLMRLHRCPPVVSSLNKIQLNDPNVVRVIVCRIHKLISIPKFKNVFLGIECQHSYDLLTYSSYLVSTKIKLQKSPQLNLFE